MRNTDKGQELSLGGRCRYATAKGGTASDFPDLLLNAGRTMESHQYIVTDNRPLPIGFLNNQGMVQRETEKMGKVKR